ncbi:hypothetical protein [Acidipila rosea]|uniref:Uncharacterized protein n=1 Tax=Acidipila rosea TaxID=768535 RepID=A0A4R1LBI7_9BACT|nr:hypothetical protein [Acidipila rosea]TCK74293.1 hypothetical protein C7378_1915 [Acidipila rosea]
MKNCEDANGAGLAQDAAVELFQVAAMLLGDENEAVGLVEQTVSSAEIDPCLDPDAARTIATGKLVDAAISLLQTSDPSGFRAASASGAATIDSCIESDDIAAAGLTPDELENLISGNGRSRLRAWLRELPVAQRAVFVQRAVLGESNAAVAARLSKNSGAEGQPWTAEATGNTFRQALCSLANSLVHSNEAQASV